MNPAIPINQLVKAYKNKDTPFLQRALFDHNPYPGQVPIIEAITYGTPKRWAAITPTRYGKTQSVANGLAASILLEPEPLVYRAISAQAVQYEKLRTYLTQAILKCRPLQELLDADVQGLDRLKKEVSKRRLTFKDGKELNLVSGWGDAARIVGDGGHRVVVDEADLIQDPAHENIFRMAAEDPDMQLGYLSNPWKKSGMFYRHWTNPAFTHHHVDYHQAIKEGRFTEEQIEEQRSVLTPTRFTIFWEARFPDVEDDALIHWDWIKAARARWDRGPPRDLADWPGRAGLDVAEGGDDHTVLAQLRQEGQCVWVEDLLTWDVADTMATVSRARPHLKDRDADVDAIGVGKGTYDRLKELGYRVRPYKASTKPRSSDYANRKAEDYWYLRRLFEAGADSDSDTWIAIPPNEALMEDLGRLRSVESTAHKIRVDHVGTKSPDHADALMMGVRSRRAIGMKPRYL